MDRVTNDVESLRSFPSDRENTTESNRIKYSLAEECAATIRSPNAEVNPLSALICRVAKVHRSFAAFSPPPPPLPPPAPPPPLCPSHTFIPLIVINSIPLRRSATLSSRGRRNMCEKLPRELQSASAAIPNSIPGDSSHVVSSGTTEL